MGLRPDPAERNGPAGPQPKSAGLLPSQRSDPVATGKNGVQQHRERDCREPVGLCRALRESVWKNRSTLAVASFDNARERLHERVAICSRLSAWRNVSTSPKGAVSGPNADSVELEMGKQVAWHGASLSLRDQRCSYESWPPLFQKYFRSRARFSSSGRIIRRWGQPRPLL